MDNFSSIFLSCALECGNPNGVRCLETDVGWKLLQNGVIIFYYNITPRINLTGPAEPDPKPSGVKLCWEPFHWLQWALDQDPPWTSLSHILVSYLKVTSSAISSETPVPFSSYTTSPHFHPTEATAFVLWLWVYFSLVSSAHVGLGGGWPLVADVKWFRVPHHISLGWAGSCWSVKHRSIAYCSYSTQKGGGNSTHPLQNGTDISQEQHRLLVYFQNVVYLCPIWSSWTAGLLADFSPAPSFFKLFWRLLSSPQGNKEKGLYLVMNYFFQKWHYLAQSSTIKKNHSSFWAGFQELTCCFPRYVRPLENKSACFRGEIDMCTRIDIAFGIGGSGSYMESLVNILIKNSALPLFLWRSSHLLLK